MASDKYLQKFQSLCAMANDDSTTLQIDELRRIILHRSTGVCPATMIVSKEDGSLLSVKQMCTEDAYAFMSRKPLYDDQTMEVFAQTARKMELNMKPSNESKCVKGIQRELLEDLAQKYKDDCKAFRKSLVHFRFNVVAVHICRWDGSPRKSVSEIRDAICLYPSTFSNMKLFLKGVLKVVLLSTGLIAGGVALRQRLSKKVEVQDIVEDKGSKFTQFADAINAMKVDQRSRTEILHDDRLYGAKWKLDVRNTPYSSVEEDLAGQSTPRNFNAGYTGRTQAKVVSRFHPPPVDYLRKMGFMEKKPLPTCTLDMFFSITTHGGDTAHQMPEEYVRLVPRSSVQDEQNYTPMNPDICRSCFNTLVKVYSQGFEVCGDCGNVVCNPEKVATCSTSSLGGTVGSSAGARRLTTYMYKRTNHFLDHLKRVQAKQSSSVRPEIIATVENELRKERIHAGDAAITTTKIRSLLKKLKLQKHYIYVFQITSKLSGKAPPELTLVQEEKLLEMFQSIQGPFQKHCPPDRTNMLNYSFILRKLTQILGWYELMDFFPLLKSRSKVHAQDMLWKKICDEAHFPFHKSIA